MAILVDFNNVVTAGILATLYDSGSGAVIDEDFIRHLSIVFFTSYKKKYRRYGEVVLCCDGSNSWRKGVYPYYKANRKRDLNQAPQAGELDWKEFYRVLNLVREEMKDFMPYRVLHLDRVEGDDAIAVIAKEIPGPHVIVSNDKDFGQLQRYDGVIQYSPLKLKEIKIDDPLMYLKEQIIRGDGVDFVPNILSDDDVLVNKEKRQKAIFKKKLPDYLREDLSVHFEEANIIRNTKMIDFEEIPQEYQDQIIRSFEEQSEKKVSKNDVLQYFITKKLVRLIDDIQNI